MRFLFALLVLVNVGLYMWGTWYKAPPAPASFVTSPEINREKLRLLSEPGVKLVGRKTQLPPPAPLPTADGPACLALGPFATPAAAQQAGRQLQTWQLQPTERIEHEPLSAAFQVYLPPLPTKTEAERKRRELTRIGFTDHALITDDELANGISLGLFSREANARLRLRQLAAKGVRAELQALPGSRALHWLDLAGEIKDGRLGTVAITALAAYNWGPEIQLYPSRCPPPASAPPPS